MQTVLFTSVFEKKAARAGLVEADMFEIASVIASDPTSGDLIKGTGGLRKIRFARAGEGKSGGYRTIHYFAGEDIPIFMLDLVDKKERANLSQAERNKVAKELPFLAADYRSRNKTKT